MILKVENVVDMDKLQTQQSHIPQMHQLQNTRQRSVKQDHENIQTIQHQQRNHHHVQNSRQSNSHQSQQNSLQQSVMDSEPPPLVPILPPVSTITGGVNLTCNLCGKHFRRQKTYETHLSVAHPKQV